MSGATRVCGMAKTFSICASGLLTTTLSCLVRGQIYGITLKQSSLWLP